MSDFNFAKMAKKIHDRVQEKAVSALENLKIKTTSEVQKQRYDICLSCDKLYWPTKTCRVCGCFMNIKTWMPEQSCPLKKWTEAEPNINQNDTNMTW